MTRLVADAPTTLTCDFRAGDGAEVTVTATGAVAGVLVDEAPASFVEDVGADLSRWGYDLSGWPTPDQVTLVWSYPGGTSQQTVDVVGALYATVADVRAHPSIDDSARWSDAQIDEQLERVESVVEDYCKRSFVPRVSVVTRRLRSPDVINVPKPPLRDILSATVAGGAASTIEADSDVTIYLPSEGRWTLVIEHGDDRPPTAVSEAVVAATARRLIDGFGQGVRNTRTQVAEDVSYLVQQQSARHDRPFGIPSVDSVLELHRFQVVG